MPAEVRLAHDPAEVDAALELRARVFCDEQGVAFEAEHDGRDAEAAHVVALEAGRLVGTCRLLRDGEVVRLGRMAVEPGRRGGGLGRALLEFSESWARDAGARRIALHAQTRAVALYAAGGFSTCGEPFLEEGIDHVAMEKRLA